MVSSTDILNARILIVDDQELNVRVLQRTLEGAGYVSITSTMDPGAVRELYLEHRFDLILLDLEMPGMDGFQVMEALTGIESSDFPTVLVITAEPSHKRRALKAGAQDFFSKPFVLEEVLLRVRNLLETHLLRVETKKLSDQLVELQELLKSRKGGQEGADQRDTF